MTITAAAAVAAVEVWKSRLALTTQHGDDESAARVSINGSPG